MQVTLVYFDGCPHVVAARAHISEALAKCGVVAAWVDVDRDDPATDARFRVWPSPTVLVDGVPVGGQAPTDGRVACASQGAPSVDAIEEAVRARVAEQKP